MKLLFSACLLGARCRYDGAACENAGMLELWRREGGLVVCPEQLGGLSTPRRPATLVGGDGGGVLDGKAVLLDDEEEDVTGQFVRGAGEAVRLAGLAGVTIAYLKGGSPSCGVSATSILWKRAAGRGVTAALLARHGIELVEIE